MSRVAVVIATRNRRSELLRTLSRLAALPERPPVVVVDNGSSDGSVAAVAAEHPGVRIVPLGHNAGAAAVTSGSGWRAHRTSPSATTTPGGSRARWRGPPRCSTRIRGWG